MPALVPSAAAADDQYGASVPYTRYEAEEAEPFQWDVARTFRRPRIDGRGPSQSYVALMKGA